MEVINWNEALIPYKQATDELFIKFEGIKNNYIQLEKHSPIELVQARVKSISGILEKASKRDIPANKIFEELYDIAGIRIICKFVEDIKKVINLIRERNGKDLTIIEEEDYIINTKSSGYRSYHITINYPVITVFGTKNIFCEIQIRTMAMNFWATIEHSIRYKYNGNMPEELKKRLQVCAEASFKLDNEMSTIRDEIIQVQKIIQVKEHLVSEIIKNIQNLYYIGKLENMTEFNNEFIDIYQAGDLDELQKFNQKIITFADLYKVRYL